MQSPLPPPPALRCTSPIQLMSLVSSILHLPDQTLATAYIYLNIYRRFASTTVEGESLEVIDPHTVALTAISLACKATMTPRRLSSILVPAHNLLHPASPPIDIPSLYYDALRGTIVRAEMVLLRVLGFATRIPTPLEWIEEYVENALFGLESEDSNNRTFQQCDEDMVVAITDTSLGKSIATRCVDACKDYELANFYPTRAITAACVFLELEKEGAAIVEDVPTWLDRVTHARVEEEDFRYVVLLLRKGTQ